MEFFHSNLFVLFILLSAVYGWEKIYVIDGHNDLAHRIRTKVNLKLSRYPFLKNLANDPEWGLQYCTSCHTDFPRLKEGYVGAQFWAAYVDCSTQYKDAVERTLEQIELIHRFIEKYPNELQFATSVKDIQTAQSFGRIASLIGVEGGHSIDSRLSILRLYYKLGVRYMTLTHACNTPWADSSPVDVSPNLPNHSGLTKWGMETILEMNRIGMLVDLSHVSYNVMRMALNVSKAPVIFSHSSAFALNPHHRNVRDDILLKLKQNNGIIMVNFFPDFICRNPSMCNITNVAAHITYIANLIGVDHVGIGADYDGVDNAPKGLEDVSKYQSLLQYLQLVDPVKWNDANLKKLAHENILRVFSDVEKIRDHMANTIQPDDNEIPNIDLILEDGFNDNIKKCRSDL